MLASGLSHRQAPDLRAQAIVRSTHRWAPLIFRKTQSDEFRFPTNRAMLRSASYQAVWPRREVALDQGQIVSSRRRIGLTVRFKTHGMTGSPTHPQQISVRNQLAFLVSKRLSFGRRAGWLAALELGGGACVLPRVGPRGPGFRLQAFSLQPRSSAFLSGNILHGRHDFGS